MKSAATSSLSGGSDFRSSTMISKRPIEFTRPELAPLRFSSASRLDDLVNPPTRELIRPLPLRLFGDNPEHFWLGGGQPHILTDAERNEHILFASAEA